MSRFSWRSTSQAVRSRPGGVCRAGVFRANALAGAGLGLSLGLLSLCLNVACGARSSVPVGYAGDDAKAFVVKHRAELQTEIAAGSGRRIYDLAILADCQDVPTLSRRLHRHQDDFFGPAGAAPGAVADADVAERMVRFMSDNREFRCLSLDLSRSRMMSAGTRHIGPRRSQVTARGGSW